MDPDVPLDDEDNARHSTDIPSHGSIPKWLEDLSQKVIKTHSLHAERKKSLAYNLGVKNFLDTFDTTDLKRCESGSARFGRRASFSSQLLSSASPSESRINSAKSEYLIPKFDGKFDLKILRPDPYQMDLEKSWRSLDHFQQSHKGRLDSARTLDIKKYIGEYDYILSPISSNEDSQNEVLSDYSPSILTKNVPNRSSSELSYYTKLEQKIDVSPNNQPDLLLQTKYDPIFERKLNEYQMKIDKENQLREEIICELLAENERITEKLKLHTLDSEGFPSVHRKIKCNNKNHKKTKDCKISKNVFIIPELPTGQTLIIDILSTWGDKYYVGLNGIDIFGIDGQLIRVKNIIAIPSDVNVLPECNNDPRVVSNLLDGVNRTQDDMHIWLAPFEIGGSHIVTVEFEEVSTLSMMRIWNYNKSRIHSYRGARDIVMYLDDVAIFKGEIAKACGGILGGIHAFGDTILFTTNEQILENIAKHDPSYSSLTSGPNTPTIRERPPTATLISDIRPTTGATVKNSPTDQILLGASQIDLVLLSNWGHKNMIGLTAFEIVQGTNIIINVKQSCLSCSVNYENSILSRLIDGVNVTNDSSHMWWVPFTYDEEVTIRITFEDLRYVSGIRIWNYNGDLESSYAGVRAMKITLDGKPVTNPLTKSEIFILRRAPGNQHYDFVQDVKFAEDTNYLDQTEPSLLVREEYYEPSSMPEGFVFQFIVFSSWGDQYYCGLNGIELYNQYGRKIVLEEQNICAYPESVNSLPKVSGDIRMPIKLIDGINDDHSGVHSWLAPIIPKHLNRIYMVMDQPIVVSLVKLWNYSKTPTRGIKEFGILVDDLLVYTGNLEQYAGDKDNCYQTVLFAENEAIIGEDYDELMRNGAFVQDVILLDQDGRTTAGGSLSEADPDLRPFTSVNQINRAYTSFSH